MSAGRRLVRALKASAATAGCSARITVAGEKPWSSATFTGTRHEVSVESSVSLPFATWLDGLEGMRLTLPGHVIAEMVVRRREGGAGLDVLTLEASSSAGSGDY